MATFVKPDGTAVKPQVLVPRAEGLGLIGYIEEFETFVDNSSMERVITIKLRVNELNINHAGGLVPHIKAGGKIQIRAVR